MALQKRHIKFALRILGPYKRYYAWCVLALIIASALNVCSPFITGMVFDQIISLSSQANSLEHERNINIYVLVLLLFSVNILYAGLSQFVAYYVSSRSEFISNRLRCEIIENIFSIKTYPRRKASVNLGELTSYISRDVEILWDLLGFATTELLSAILTIIFMLSIIFYVNAYVGISIAIFILVYVTLYYSNGRSIRNSFATVAPIFDQLMGYFTQLVKAYDTVIATNSQKWAMKVFKEFSYNVASGSAKAHRKSTVFSFFTSLSISLFALVLWVIAIPSLTGASRSQFLDLTIGEFITVLFYLNIALKPLETISDSAKVFLKSLVSLDRLELFLRGDSGKWEQHMSRELSNETLSTQTSRSVVLNSVSIGGNGNDTYILKNVSLTFESGKIYGLAGKTGSGKSTLLKTIARLYEPLEGKLELFKVNFAQISEVNFRKMVIYIEQESILLPLPIIDNIQMGISVTEEEMKVVASRTCSEELVHRGTAISDANQQGLIDELSGGERQRISLGRGVLRQPKVLLLDEPSSALDTDTTSKIANTFEELKCLGTTIIIASHDPVLLSKCDQIIVMENGNVVQINHQETLMDKNGQRKSLVGGANA